jgi:hypothetical protein
MNNEVYGAEDKRGVDERRNAIHSNASVQKSKVIAKKSEDKKNGGIHDNNAKTKRENDNRSENKRKDGLKDCVQKRENERDKNQFWDVGGYDEPGNPQIRKPKPESVPRNDDGDP